MCCKIKTCHLLLAASSSSCGLLVAPTTSTLSSPTVLAPSSCTRNSVLILRLDSWSESDLPNVEIQEILFSRLATYLAVSRESISSMKITLGSWTLATANNALTIFSPSPTHLEVKEDADMEKNVDPD